VFVCFFSVYDVETV